MTTTIHIKNHTAIANDRYTQVFKDKPNIAGMTTAFVNQIQKLENVFQDLGFFRFIYTASGEQLDGLGSIVGEQRQGRNDFDYRIAIITRIAINTSDGTPEEFIAILNLVTGSTQVFYYEIKPASVMAFVNTNIDFSIDNISSDSFAFEGGIDGLGFSDVFFPNQGGVFSGFNFKDVNFIYLLANKILPAGVRLDAVGWYDPNNPFGFENDANNAGFGDAFDSTVGGLFAKISQHTIPFGMKIDSELILGFGDTRDNLVGGNFFGV